VADRSRSRGQARTELVEYGPTSEGDAAEDWRRSVLFHLLQTGGSLFRVRFHAGEIADFPTIAQMRGKGMSDVTAMITRFPRSGAIGEMNSLYSYWASDHPHGFDDAHVEALAGLMPMRALAVKCVSLARIAGTLVETYLGRPDQGPLRRHGDDAGLAQVQLMLRQTGRDCFVASLLAMTPFFCVIASLDETDSSGR
jgi:adenylate cyclase